MRPNSSSSETIVFFLLGRIFQPQFLVDLIASGQTEEGGDEE